MKRDNQPSIGILFAQFSAYHVDRCEAAAARLAGRYRVLAVEVATRSLVYAWDPSGAVAGAEKVTLFPGEGYEDVGLLRSARACFGALRRCSVVFLGLPYSFGDALVLSWLLRLAGVRVVVLTESKFDDLPRSLLREWGKSLLLRAYRSAMVGGRRQAEYMRWLGFRARPVVLGYDTVSVERVRAEAAGAARLPWEERPFVFVGRFVEKKNLPRLLRAFAHYRRLEPRHPRRLKLVGDGELRGELEALAAELGVADAIEWTGFLSSAGVSRHLAEGVGLCLVSTEEQWGLVVNEALALGLPAIVSSRVGACDALVRSGLNGWVVEPGDEEQIGQAMWLLGEDREAWEQMSAHSTQRAWLGDSTRFADAVESLLGDASAETASRLTHFERAVGLE